MLASPLNIFFCRRCERLDFSRVSNDGCDRELILLKKIRGNKESATGFCPIRKPARVEKKIPHKVFGKSCLFSLSKSLKPPGSGLGKQDREGQNWGTKAGKHCGESNYQGKQDLGSGHADWVKSYVN